jgi:hypothetical protein
MGHPRPNPVPTFIDTKTDRVFSGAVAVCVGICRLHPETLLLRFRKLAGDDCRAPWQEHDDPSLRASLHRHPHDRSAGTLSGSAARVRRRPADASRGEWP